MLPDKYVQTFSNSVSISQRFFIIKFENSDDVNGTAKSKQNLKIFLSFCLENHMGSNYIKKRCRKVLQFQYQISKDFVFWVNNIRDLQYCTIKKIKNYEYLYTTVELMATFRGNILKTTKWMSECWKHELFFIFIKYVFHCRIHVYTLSRIFLIFQIYRWISMIVFYVEYVTL